MNTDQFLMEDYKLKVSYLTSHLQRMWTRFNFFITIQSGLVAFFFTSSRDLTSVALYFACAEAVIALIWYVFGAQDRYLFLMYRSQIEITANKLVGLIQKSDQESQDLLKDYIFVGETTKTAQSMKAEGKMSPFEWRSNAISITRLAAIFPLIVFVFWSSTILVLILS